MTTPIVLSITDEQLAELEEYSEKKAFVCCGNLAVGGEYMGAQEMVCCGEPELTEVDINTPAKEILGLIARLRAAEKDAARYRWLRDKAQYHASQAPAIVMLTGYCQPAFDRPGSAHLSTLYGEHAEIAIDTAMEKQP